MSPTDLLTAAVLALAFALLVALWFSLISRWRFWRVDKSGRHLEIEKFSEITKVPPSGSVVLRFRVHNRTNRTVGTQISYGDDPRHQAAHQGEYTPWETVLDQAEWTVNDRPTKYPGFDLGPEDGADVEMRLKPHAAGKTRVSVSVISHGFGAQWSDETAYEVEVNPEFAL